jgi:nucleoside-diphosphate-sugar epimerase
VPRALVLGGTGAIGRATAARLLATGWEVDRTGRDPAHMPASLAAAGARFHAAAPAGTPDLLVDCACFTAADAERLLLPLARDAGSTVMISSKAVYVDAEGRHSNTDEPPRFDGPVAETQPTMAPSRGDHTTREGYGANKVAAEQVLLDSGLPVTVLRPSKVHGAGSRLAREWVFVKRALDRRPVVVLAHRGEGGDHPSAALNIAALIEVVAARPGTRILNAADPDAPNGLEISRAIARHLGHAREEILLDDGAPAGLGRHPWDRRPPVVVDTTAALALGYVPVGDYAATVANVVDWLVQSARGGEDGALLPTPDDATFAPLLDYAAEDSYLRAHEIPL